MQYQKTAYLTNFNIQWLAIFVCGLILFFIDVTLPIVDYAVLVSTALFIFHLLLSTEMKIIYIARLFLFVLVGLYAYSVKVFSPDTYFSVFEFSTQRLDVARKMYGATLVGLPFCYLGLIKGELMAHYFSNKFRPTLRAGNPYIFIFLIGLSLTALSIYITLTNSKGSILQGAYGGSIEGTPLPLGGINIVAGIGIIIMLFSALKKSNLFMWLIFSLSTLYYIIFCLVLRGLRQDLASLIFSIAVTSMVVKSGQFRLKLKYLYVLLPSFALLELFGIVRSGLSQWINGKIPFSDVLKIGLGNGQYADVIYSGTLGPISTTFANTIDGLFFNSIPNTFGKGYFEYVIRLLPEFIYPQRPQDYAHFFKGTYSSGGGIFELAEAIINFNIFGPILIPFVVSLVFSFLYNMFETRRTLFWTIIFGAIACSFLRGAWYQTFAYVKALEIGIIFSTATYLVVLLNLKTKELFGVFKS